MKLKIRYTKHGVKLTHTAEVDDLPQFKTWQFWSFGDRFHPLTWEGDEIKGEVLEELSNIKLGNFIAEVSW